MAISALGARSRGCFTASERKIDKIASDDLLLTAAACKRPRFFSGMAERESATTGSEAFQKITESRL